MKKLTFHVRVRAAGRKSSEWAFQTHRKVTFGPIGHASVPLEGEKTTRTLIIQRNGRFQLRVPAGLEGHINVDSKEISFASLREFGLLKSDRAGEYLSIAEKTSGTFKLGETVLDFWATPTPQEFLAEKSYSPFREAIRETPWKTGVIYLMMFFVHFGTLKMLYRYPIPVAELEDIQRRYIRFELPTKAYVSERLRSEARSNSKLTLRDRKEPLPNRVQGFLSAVKVSQGKNSLYANLFTTAVLNQKLEKMLSSSKGFEKAAEESLKNYGSTVGNTRNESPELVRIGSVEQQNLKESHLTKEISQTVPLRFSYEGAVGGGAFDRGALENLVKSKEAELRDCYERALTRVPSLSGKLVVRLILRPNGPIISIDEKSTLKDFPLHRCVLDRMKNWPFQTPEKETDPIALPFIFSSASRG